MSRNARKAERRRLKRQEKRRSIRRMESVSPYRKLATRGEIVACYVNGRWKDNGLASVFALKQTPGGGYAMAVFLIDLWCMGLKDAYGRLDVTRGEFQETLERYPDVAELVRLDPDQAKRLVAGGIRFARQNGFRLPEHYARWVRFFGELGDCSSADVSDFGTEGGKLRYVGPIDHLQERLIGSRVDEFLGREDVETIIALEGGFVREPASTELSREAERRRNLAIERVSRWCIAHNETPHPLVGEALDIMLHSLRRLIEASADESLADDEAEAAAIEAGNELLSLCPPDARSGMMAAMDQVSRFMRSFGRVQEVLRVFGVLSEEDKGEEAV